MAKDGKEWIEQAEYDFKTAQAMFDAKRYVYTIFMCHLAIEKALKAIVLVETKKLPPKTHELIKLMTLGKTQLPMAMVDFVGIINNVAVVTRYPEDFKLLIKNYPKNVTKQYLNRTAEVLKCLQKDPRLRA